MHDFNAILSASSFDWQFLNATVGKAGSWTKSLPDFVGGVVALRDLTQAEGRTLCLELGNVPADHRAVACYKSAGEQITRLYQNGGLRSIDTSNWDIEIYAGGIRIEKYLIAFAGFGLKEDWKLNEAVSVVIGAYLLTRDKGLMLGEGENEYRIFNATALQTIALFLDRAQVHDNILIKEFGNSVFGLKP